MNRINNRKTVKVLSLLIAFIGIFTLSGGALAAELSFSVKTNIPENQRSKNSYFDLNMKPDQKQTLEVELTNHTDQEIEIASEVHAATTNVNGVVEYGKSNSKLDKTAPYDITKIVTAEEDKVKLAANETKIVKYNVEMPSESYDGILAGGITYQEIENTKDKKEDEKEGMAIENKFAYALAIILRENDTEIAADLKLNNVKADQLNARNVISSELQNPMARYINMLSIDATVTEKDKTEVLYKRKSEELQMAPNTTMAYPIRLEGEELKAGKYTMHIKAASGDNKWELEKDFEITGEEARTLNKADVSIEKDNTMLYMAIGFGLLLLLTIIMFVVLNKRNKEKMEAAIKEANQKNQSE